MYTLVFEKTLLGVILNSKIYTEELTPNLFKKGDYSNTSICFRGLINNKSVGGTCYWNEDLTILKKLQQSILKKTIAEHEAIIVNLKKYLIS